MAFLEPSSYGIEIARLRNYERIDVSGRHKWGLVSTAADRLVGEAA